MSIWNLEGGGSALDGNGTMEIEGGFAPIPDGTTATALIEEINWDSIKATDFNPSPAGLGRRFIKVKWGVLAPEPVKGRKVFQKLWVGPDLDPNAEARGPDKAVKKKNTAIRMLHAIYVQAGMNPESLTAFPDDAGLAALANRVMGIRIGLMSAPRSDGTMGHNNWVQAIGPRDRFTPMMGLETVAAPSPRQPVNTRFDDSIPF